MDNLMSFPDSPIGGAWPFLVRGMICQVNSDNERDVHPLLKHWEAKPGSLRIAMHSEVLLLSYLIAPHPEVLEGAELGIVRLQRIQLSCPGFF